ncbi:MAG: hypothetical protein JKY08_07395 [Flavobacteriaceae bacterium]|nr:hypothetical protein [Flavobacteriaceae bacterium]
MDPLGNELIDKVLNIVFVGLNGNGVSRVFWYEKQLYEEIRTQNYEPITASK